MDFHLHLDEARAGAVSALNGLLTGTAAIERAVLIDDLFGRVRAIVWPALGADETGLREAIVATLRSASGQYWTGDLWLVGTAATKNDQIFFDAAWSEGVAVDSTGRLRLNDRHRNRSAWFLPRERSRPIWAMEPGPPVVVFHSIKGGVGRTTALASYAISRARRGERIAVVDFDLDAPGLGRLLDADGEGTTARWGVVDFLLESTENLPLDDYRHACARELVTGGRTIDVFPAGSLDDSYLTKLARVDLEVGSDAANHPLQTLLRRIRDELHPAAILIDARAGLSPAAGLLLSGLAHLHILFATTSAQSLSGLSRVVRHLGFEQARRRLPQSECVVVQAMVPDNTEIAATAQADFTMQVEAIFRDHYYTAERDDEDRLWSIDDMSSSVAPHMPVPISYRDRLAFFRQIDHVANQLASDLDYAALKERVDARLGLPSPMEG